MQHNIAQDKASGREKANPPKKKQRTLPVEEIDEDDVSEVSSWDSNSSWEWELDPDKTTVAPPSPPIAEVAAAPQALDDVYHLPDEVDPQLQPEINSEDEDDHTGVWRDGDLEFLILALNHYRSKLKGKFLGCAGGKRRRDKAWDDVVVYVNARCDVKWTKAQCKGKARRYGQVVKTKYNKLRREIFKTGGGEIDDECQLTDMEEAMLDYIGVEGVVGLPGMHGTSLKPNQGHAHRHKLNEAAKMAWDPNREDRRSYLTLPQEKVKLSKKKKK